MIVGLGIDVSSIERQRSALSRFGERLWQRILTENERADLSQRPDRALALAGRFAAKEAAAKALGGQPDVWWHHVEIRPNPRGAPQLTFLGPARAHADSLGRTSRFRLDHPRRGRRRGSGRPRKRLARHLGHG